MCDAFKFFVYIGISCCCFMALLNAQEEAEHQQVQQYKLKNCTASDDCPDHADCTPVNESLKCICSQGYQHNPQWLSDVSNVTAYCVTIEGTNATIVLFTRAEPRADHLAVVIFLILSGVLVVTLVFYFMVVLRPIDRTKAVYHRLRLRRTNHRRLDEFEDVDMTFRTINAGGPNDENCIRVY